MPNSIEPAVILSHLHRADGSATFSQDGYTVIGAVNGPIEIQRRDELPEEAAVEVLVRPAAGVGGTRERHLESILQSTLRQIILIHNYPRSLIQVTLQITSTPENDAAGAKLVQASLNLPILPALLQTSILTLLSASIPLATTLTSVLLAISSEGIIRNPTLQELEGAESLHVMGFTSQGELLVAESEGSFTTQEWNGIHDVSRRICYGSTDESGEDDESMMKFVKSAIAQKVKQDLQWKK